MIIKSMSRKDTSFGQLLAYVNREAADAHYSISHNLLAREEKEMVLEFNENAALLPKRKNGNTMYHEIVSISRTDKIPEAKQKEMLREITQKYIKERAPHCLVYGALHDDHKNHLHFHLVISANGIGLSKRHYHSKKHFRKMAKTLESHVLGHYPELDQKVSIGKEAAMKLTDKEKGHKIRTGKKLKKEELAEKFARIFEEAPNRKALFQAIHDEGYKFYIRGKSIGIEDLTTGRKHRLKTLGIMADFQKLSVRMEAEYKQMKSAKASARQPRQVKTRAKKTAQKQPKSKLPLSPVPQTKARVKRTLQMPPVQQQIVHNQLRHIATKPKQVVKQAVKQIKEKQPMPDPMILLKIAGAALHTVADAATPDAKDAIEVASDTPAAKKQESQQQKTDKERLAIIEERMQEMETLRQSKQSNKRKSSMRQR